MRDAGRRLGGAPWSAAPAAVSAEGGTCPAVAAGPRFAAFVWGCRGPAHPAQQLRDLVQIAAVSSVYRDRSKLKA